MRKIRTGLFILILTTLFCGCSFMNAIAPPTVEWMGNWSFQENEDTNEYILFFALKDSDEKEIAAEANVDIRIENEFGDIVYKGQTTISEQDFGTYTSAIQGEHYLAAIRIPAADIQKGKSASGKVYFTVYQDHGTSFEEVSCEAYECLPIQDFNITAEGLPAEIHCYGYDGTISSTLNITQLIVETEGDYSPHATATVLGEKTYDRGGTYDSIYDKFEYKLYDSNGYVIDTGPVFLDNIAVGDKFREELILPYDLTPGEAYTITFSPVD